MQFHLLLLSPSLSSFSSFLTLFLPPPPQFCGDSAVFKTMQMWRFAWLLLGKGTHTHILHKRERGEKKNIWVSLAPSLTPPQFMTCWPKILLEETFEQRKKEEKMRGGRRQDFLPSSPPSSLFFLLFLISQPSSVFQHSFSSPSLVPSNPFLLHSNSSSFALSSLFFKEPD